MIILAALSSRHQLTSSNRLGKRSSTRANTPKCCLGECLTVEFRCGYGAVQPRCVVRLRRSCALDEASLAKLCVSSKFLTALSEHKAGEVGLQQTHHDRCSGRVCLCVCVCGSAYLLVRDSACEDDGTAELLRLRGELNREVGTMRRQILRVVWSCL